MLPQHRRFAADFMAKEGLEAVDAATFDRVMDRDPADRDGPAPLSREFFEAQMEVVIEERVPLYAAGLGSHAPCPFPAVASSFGLVRRREGGPGRTAAVGWQPGAAAGVRSGRRREHAQGLG